MQQYFLAVLLLFTACTPPLREYEQAARQWETDIRRFEHLDSTETDPANAILFTGSSSIRLWETIREDMAPYPVIQRGFGGSKMSDVAVYTKRIVYPHRFRALAIFVANDITGSADDKTPVQVADLFAHIHRTVRKKYPTQPIYFIEITPTNSRWKVWPQISQANQRIKAFCERQRNTYFIDTAAAFIGPDGKPRADLFISDQLHLNREGYKLWAEIIRKKIDATLR
ncbi:MAG: GDSL-type esterase/lipase family protein [Cytophagales bacterium]|nr:GDSL-type esterase/lipase family protein [Cytophagales bacterium]